MNSEVFKKWDEKFDHKSMNRFYGFYKSCEAV